MSFKLVRPATITDAILVSTNVAEADYAAYSAATVYATGTRVIVVSTNVHKVYESLTGSTSTVTMTIASPCVVTWTAHGLAANTPISFTTTGALPTGLVSGTVYYVIAPTTDTFNVSATSGGSAINTSGSQSGVHTAVASTNYNKTPATSPTFWLDVGATNRWKMFDSSVGSQTTNANSIDCDFETGGLVDSVVLLNVSALTAQVVVTDDVEGVVYDTTVNLIDDSGITDWYAYFFEPIVRITDVALTDLPPYADTTISVTLTESGETVACGVCVLGLSRDIGATQYGARLGIQDYSIKQQDAFGNYTILERAFNRRSNFTVWVDSTFVDAAYNLISSYRATPIVYLGASDSYKSTIVYGFYRDFSIEISYPTVAMCSIELEGLT